MKPFPTERWAMPQLDSSPHILVVDDEPPLMEELSEFLALNGMAVCTASSSIEALTRLAGDSAITLVLSDIRMPDLDGLALANRILKARSDADAIEVVLMTGHGSVETAARAVRAGVFDFLCKPMVLDETLTVLRSAQAKAAARRRAHAARLAESERIRADYAALQAHIASSDKSLSLTDVLPRELASILSHELRTPLVPLLALPELLNGMGELLPGSLNALLRDVQQAGERLTEIADDLIEFLAPPRPDGLASRPVPLATLLSLLRSRFLDQAKGAGVTLALTEVADGDVVTDEARLLHALGRLASNALAATPPSGRIELSVRPRGPDSVAFAVRDNGRGMTAAEIKVALAPFYQLDMSLARRTGGMGLGLPLASRMAARLGGRLEIESMPAGGTTATIVLPRLSNAERKATTVDKTGQSVVLKPTNT